MKKIPLTRGQFALVDDEDFEEISKFKWHARYVKQRNIFYAERRDGLKMMRMHRVINKTKDGLLTDHIDGNTLDNRKKNLRSCTVQQNAWNSGKQKHNTTGFKGVTYHKLHKKWIAAAKLNQKNIHIGCFNTPEEASLAYISFCKNYHGLYLYKR